MSIRMVIFGIKYSEQEMTDCDFPNSMGMEC